MDAEEARESLQAKQEIKTEPFRFGINPPISLNKKLDTPTQKHEPLISPLESSLSESYQSPKSITKEKNELGSIDSSSYIDEELQSSDIGYKESKDT